MKLAILFLLLTSLFLLNSSLSTNFHEELSSLDDKVLKFVCRIVNDITNTMNDTQDILIGHIGGSQRSQAVNDVTQCIDRDKAVIVTNFYEVTKEKQLRKASVIVLVSYQPDKNLIRQLISSQLFSTVWHHMAKIICILPSTSIHYRSVILHTFARLGFYNVVTVHEDINGDFIFDVLKPASVKVSTLINPQDSSMLFPDKLKDMSQYRYKIPVFDQPPQITIKNHNVWSPMLHFLYEVSKKQNASLQLNILPNSTYLSGVWQTRQMHLTINTAASFDNPEPKLITYEKRGFCALVPIPQKTLAFRVMIIMPFDFRIWVPLVVSIAGSVAIWWLYQGRGAVDSQWLLLAEIYKMFFGQGFTLSRNNHFMLLALMQLICLLIFVISNAYESEITSCMIEPFNENRLETVEDLLASNYEIVTDEGFAFILNSSDGYKELKSKIKKTDVQLLERFHEEIQQKHSVLIGMCDVLEVDLKREHQNGLISDYFYMLPEVILWDFVRLEASYLNPFLERFQFFMDLSFQGGLPYIWKLIENGHQLWSSMHDSSDVLESLRIEDLHEVFKVLGIGLTAAIFVFLCEISYHDCLRYFDMRDFVEYLRKKLQNLIGKLRASRHNVRTIRVQPRN